MAIVAKLSILDICYAPGLVSELYKFSAKLPISGADPEILNRGALCVGHHGWLTKKILGFRWPKKAKMALVTICFWRNISINIFKFSPFLYTMKACLCNPINFSKLTNARCNFINFSKLTNAFIRKEKKHSYSRQCKNKSWTLFYNRLFYKTL